MSYTSRPADRYQGPPSNRYSYSGSASAAPYPGNTSPRPPPLQQTPSLQQVPYYDSGPYSSQPVHSSPLSAPPQPAGHYNAEGYYHAQPPHVTGHYPPPSQQHRPPPLQQQQIPQQQPPPAQYAYAQPPPPHPHSPLSSQHQHPPPSNQHPPPPPIAPSASAPVVSQYNHPPPHDTYRPPPANAYYSQPPAPQMHPAYQGPPPGQHPMSHSPPLPPSSGPGYYSYSQGDQGLYRRASTHSPAPLHQQYQPQQPPAPGAYPGTGYAHSDGNPPRSHASFYGSGHGVVPPGPMRSPPVRQSPVYQQQQPPQPLSQAQLQRTYTVNLPVSQHDSGRPSGSRLSMSAYPDTKPSYAADNAAPYRSSPGPYRSSPVPVNTAALPASPVNAVVYGSTPQMGGPQSAGASGMLRRGQSLYSQQRDVRVQNPPLHQGAMASLVGSMGALSLAQSQQQAGITMSQPTLVGSATMPTPYARGTQPPLQLGNSCCVGGAAENSQASLGVPANPQQSQPKAAPVVQSQATLPPPGPPDLSGSVATLAQPDCTSPFPLWSNISANSFDAYQHQVPVKQSNLTGTKYALIIGINYYELEYSQTSNINSAHSIKLLLMSRYGYQEQNIILLSDGLEDERCHPTFRGITAAIERMMSQVKPNDAVFFYFCGFGHLPYQLRDRRTEVLGAIRHLRCDYILPSDFECMGAIDAEYLHHFLVRQLPSSARLTALFNCIINETGLGVPYKYTHLNGGPVLTNAIAGKNLFEAGMNLNQMSTASFGDLSQRLESSLIQQQQRRRQQQSSGSAGALVTAEDIVRIRQSSGDIIVFGWDRNFKDPEYKKSLGQTPSNQLGSYWAAAMENAINTKGKATFGDVIGYMEGVTKDLVMLPFVACGRKIRMDEVLVI